MTRACRQSGHAISGVVFSLAFCMLCSGDLVADEKPNAKPKVSAKEVDKLVAQLGDDAFKTRKAATRKLREIGLPAVPALAKAAQSNDLEVMTRAISILRSHYPRDTKVAEAASDALEDLVWSQNTSARTRALEALTQSSELRESRAIAKIESLGGGIQYLPESYNPTGKSQIHFVFLGKSWKGGTKGLKHIARLPQLRQLYFTENCELTQQQIETLQLRVTSLDVQRRSEAYLGISGRDSFDTPGVFVNTVQDDKPADKADLREGDLIVKFGGKPVTSFRNPIHEESSLINMIEDYEPGDKVEVVFLRGDDIERKTTVTLGAWFTPQKRDAKKVDANKP